RGSGRAGGQCRPGSAWPAGRGSPCRSGRRSRRCSSRASRWARRWPRCWRVSRGPRRSASVMPELRRDPVVGRWVIISTERSRRPSDFAPAPRARKGGPCVFCGGQEHRTPDEGWALRPGRGEPNTPGWLLRVVPNKFPALRIEGELEPTGEGLYDRMNGVGAHEVVIESPDHDAVIERLPVSHLAEVFRAYRDRIVDLAKDPRLEYVMV